MKEAKRIIPIIAVIIIAAIASGIIYKLNADKYSSWDSVPGEVQEIEQLRKLKDRIYYTYTVNGKVYSGSEVVHRSSHSNAGKAGDEITVWYDTKEPASSCYLKPNPTFQATAPIFLTVPICLIIVLSGNTKLTD